ncbi:unnamed protein product [Amoebophrya sp. A25]|nr:unnamed protein product [Amoebophrya sp. A25]|eukprot:GSA25T00013419001.1
MTSLFSILEELAPTLPDLRPPGFPSAHHERRRRPFPLSLGLFAFGRVCWSVLASPARPILWAVYAAPREWVTEHISATGLARVSACSGFWLRSSTGSRLGVFSSSVSDQRAQVRPRGGSRRICVAAFCFYFRTQ